MVLALQNIFRVCCTRAYAQELVGEISEATGLHTRLCGLPYANEMAGMMQELRRRGKTTTTKMRKNTLIIKASNV